MDTHFMEAGIYAIWDDKAQGYSVPFVMPNDDVAVRMFARSLKDEQSMMFSNPEDFRLDRVGTWNPVEGGIVDLLVKEVVTGASFRKEVK